MLYLPSRALSKFHNHNLYAEIVSLRLTNPAWGHGYLVNLYMLFSDPLVEEQNLLNRGFCILYRFTAVFLLVYNYLLIETKV